MLHTPRTFPQATRVVSGINLVERYCRCYCYEQLLVNANRGPLDSQEANALAFANNATTPLFNAQFNFITLSERGSLQRIANQTPCKRVTVFRISTLSPYLLFASVFRLYRAAAKVTHR